jgi:hypothetical protein
MSPPTLFISLVRMHRALSEPQFRWCLRLTARYFRADISNPSKFRRLKRFALQADVSGLVKVSTWHVDLVNLYPESTQIGKPGVLVFDGEKECISTFLEHARSGYIILL